MKKVIVVATYEAVVPEDMTVEQLRENIVEAVEVGFIDFRVTAENYHNKEEAEPLFVLDDVSVGTEVMISVGGN